MFKTIQGIEDLRQFVAGKQEIRFHRQPNGVTIGCYLFMDSKTFDTPEALECRGIAFDATGAVVSRPLHKFFNLGEKEWLSPQALSQRRDIVALFEKLDGSMLATAFVDGQVQWRSKKSFTSDVVKLTLQFLDQPENAHIQRFAHAVASAGLTAIFEMMHPQARIVVPVPSPTMRLLHVRDNLTGAYVMLDPTHSIHQLIAEHGVALAPRYPLTSFEDIHASLGSMENQEGYVIQFANGDMVKLKCPWYQRFHRSITFLRERDIALAAINEELDDLKAVLAEAGVDLTQVNEVEARVKARMVDTVSKIEAVVAEGKHLDRKAFAMKYGKEPLFGWCMSQYLGKEPDLKDWFIKHCLKQEFSLRVLADGALAEALEG